jgi:hypothetical protein
MAKIYTIRKWRKNSKGTGAILSLSCYDEASETWANVKANVQFASNYAGKSKDEKPATLAKLDKDGNLWICCTQKDDGFNAQAEKPKKPTDDDDSDIPV